VTNALEVLDADQAEKQDNAGPAINVSATPHSQRPHPLKSASDQQIAHPRMVAEAATLFDILVTAGNPNVQPHCVTLMSSPSAWVLDESGQSEWQPGHMAGVFGDGTVRRASASIEDLVQPPTVPSTLFLCTVRAQCWLCRHGVETGVTCCNAA